jgi:hypothetical protein
MPLLIPKQEQVVGFFEPLLEHGEQIETAFWCEQRLPLWLAYLIDEIPLGDLVFMKIRHRYFACLTDRRLLFMGSTGMHNPIPTKLESYPRTSVSCSQFRNWFGGHVSMDLRIDDQVRRYRVPRSQINQAKPCQPLNGQPGPGGPPTGVGQIAPPLV